MSDQVQMTGADFQLAVNHLTGQLVKAHDELDRARAAVTYLTSVLDQAREEIAELRLDILFLEEEGGIKL